MTKFTLQFSRQVAEMAAGAIHIKTQIEAIERYVEESPSLVFDLSKSLIDTVCKTILEDRGKKLPSKTPDSPQLFKETLKALKLHHDDVDKTKKTDKNLKKIASGLQATFNAICELRNSHGLVGHGQDGYAPVMENTQAQFVASAADSIVHILYKSHKGYGENDTSVRVFYEDCEKENTHIDEVYNNDDDVFLDLVKQFRPSEILFKMDEVAYREEIEEIRNEDTV